MRGTSQRSILLPAMASTLASLVAIVVLALPIGIAGLGIFLIVDGWPSPMGIGVGVLIFTLAVVVRPRLVSHLPTTTDEMKIPRLSRLVSQLGETVDGVPLAGIVISSEPNAAFITVGFRRRHYLILGLPLLVTLEPQERVFLIGHELAHGVNHDPARGLIVGLALSSLETWVYLLDLRGSSEDAIEAIASVVMAALRAIPLAILVVLVNLTGVGTQRAEFEADRIGATMAGSRASISALVKVARCIELFSPTLLNVASRRETGEVFFQRYRSAVNEGLDRTVIDQSWRLDATHPPTGLRIDLIAKGELPPATVLSHGESSAIDDELDELCGPIGDALIDEARGAHYRR